MPSKPKLILCPYCGNTQTAPADRCGACGGHFDELSLKATQQHMGPWYIRDSHNPYRPGCTYEVLLKQVQRGKITPTTILRGPTTRQFWSVARNVPGVAHLLGYCHACGAHVEHGANNCPQCGEVFFAPKVRDNLGLAPSRLNDSGSFVTELDETGQPITQPRADRPLSMKQADAAPTPAPPRDEPDGSSILAPLRNSEPALRASAEVNASREALAWMTTQADDKPDTLATAAQPTPPKIRQGDHLTWVLVALVALMFVALVVVVLQQVLPENKTTTGTQTDPTPAPAVDPADTPTDRTETGEPNTTPQTVVNDTKPEPSEREVWQQLFDQAQQLELDGRFEEAMAFYKKIQNECPAPLKPAGLDATIHALEKKMGDEKLSEFFTG